MRRRHSQHRWRLSGRAATLAAVAVAVACSGSGSDFFQGPPIAHAGAGGKGSGGSGNSAAVGADAGNDAGGSPDATGGTGAGPGDAGSPATGGSAGKATTGGSAGKGGTGAKGGAGGTSTSGGAGLGGTAGTGGDAMPGTGGLPAGGAGAGGAGGTGGGGLGGDAGGGLGGTAGRGGMGGTGGKPCEPTEPADEICDGVDNDCHEGIDDGDVCPVGCIGAIFGKHRYLLCHAEGDEEYRRSDAKGVCNDYGDELDTTLDLVRVDSEDENAFILELIAQSGFEHPIWTGASDSTQVSDYGEGFWVWGPQAQQLPFFEDGKPVDDAFVYWAEGQPDDGQDEGGPSEDCGVYDPELDWHWNDRLCSNETPTMLCEELED